jgi:hypothetical protein
MRKNAEAAISQPNQPTVIGADEADQTWANLVKFSNAAVALINADPPRQTTSLELHAAAEFKRIRDELRTNFE